MDEAITSGAVKAVIAYFGLKGLDRLLGPTLDLYGEGLRDLHSAGNENLKKIFEKAFVKIGDEINDDAFVSPRIFHHLIQGAPYCTDEISQEYFAGIIASSRTSNGVDYFIHHAALINRMPAFHIRLHYLFYHLFFELYKESNLNMGSPIDRLAMPIFIPLPALHAILKHAFGYQKTEEFDVDDLMALHDDAVNNLYIEDLIGTYAYGSSTYFSKTYAATIERSEYLLKSANIEEKGNARDGLLISPSARGAELFCRAHGIKNKILPHFFLSSYDKTLRN